MLCRAVRLFLLLFWPPGWLFVFRIFTNIAIPVALLVFLFRHGLGANLVPPLRRLERNKAMRSRRELPDSRGETRGTIQTTVVSRAISVIDPVKRGFEFNQGCNANHAVVAGRERCVRA